MSPGDAYELLKGEIIKNDKTVVERILNDNEVIDLTTVNGSEGNLINIAIERADVDMLALLLGVRYPTDECVTAISLDQHERINSACVDKCTTPLMKAVSLQKREMVKLLLIFCTNVNDRTLNGEAAIDLSNDPNILCLLFEHDSKFPVGKEKSKAMEELISKDSGKLKELFEARDKVHEFFKGRDSSTMDTISSEIKTAVMRGKYFVNSQGQSLLCTALKNEKFRAWADLLDLGMEYATVEEKEWEMYYEKMCERALVNVLVPIDDCHIMKLATKSYNRQSISHCKEWKHIVLEYFKHMNASEITKTLMEVVQDLPGFHIVFDFESTSIERIRSCQSKDVRGIAEIDRFKICVAAKKNDEFGFPEIVSNIAHEFCHLALAVVYKNNGLPYLKDDEVRRSLYEEVMDKVRCSEGCDEIIRKVWKYPIGQHGMELIVRVPEIISKYQGRECDGLSRLKEQAEELLKFYEDHVEPELKNYLKGFFTSKRITGRGLIEYQELFSQTDGIRVSDIIEKEIMDFVKKHNYLEVINTSNLKVAKSHLQSSFRKIGKPAPFFIDWSFFLQNKDFIKKCLISREIETLAITWDDDKPPTFCSSSKCTNCTAYHLRDFKNCVYMLVSAKWRVMVGVKPLQYSWDDLSKETQVIIKERKIEFNGKHEELKTLFPSPIEGGDADKFFRDGLDSMDMNLILEGGDILIGKSNSLRDGRGRNVVMQLPESFIPRKLLRKYVNFNEDLLGNFKNDVFCIGNIEISCLRELGISEGYVKHWDGNTSGTLPQCYVLNPLSDGKSEESTIKEILDHHSGEGQGNTLHYLKFRQGMFAHISSVGIQNKTEMRKVKGLVSSRTVESLFETSVFENTDPLLIADDPGTGKTTYLHKVAEEIKENHPGKWVSIIDLGSPAQQEHLLTVKGRTTLSKEEALNLLFRLVGSRRTDSLERKIFNEFCQMKNKIIIIFDGFDEICPNYKAIVTLFIVALEKANADIKLLVSTRLHERFHLEEELGVISFELVPFSEEDQMNFLNNNWNELLKSSSLSDWQNKISSSIGSFERWVEEKHDGDICDVISKMKEMLSYSRKEQKRDRRRINFKMVARKVFFEWETLVHRLERFVDTPLHVHMFAYLIFQDSFNFMKTMNLGHLYQRFFDLKMKIYFQEKAIGSDNVQAGSTLWMAQEKMTETLEKLSVNLLQVGLSCKMKDKEIRAALNVGLVSQKGEGLQFIHRTFTEFFFARWILKEADNRDVTKLWIESLFVDDHFARVRKFLEDLLHLLSEDPGDTQDRESTEELLMLEKANLDQSVIDNPSDLENLIYCIVRECSIYTLEYFAVSFGKTCAMVIIQSFDSNYYSSALKDIMFNCWYGYKNLRYIGNINAITFAEYYFSERKVSTHHMTFVKKMLNLLKQNGMLNEMKEHLLTNGVSALFLKPSKHSIDSGGHLMYAREFLSFLLENVAIFGDILRAWMTPTSDLVTFSDAKQIFERIFADSPQLLHSVLDALYDKTQLKSMLTKEGFISLVWIYTSWKYRLNEAKQLWCLINNGLEMDKTHLRNYLDWKDDYKCNALARSANNEDPEVIEFIWELAGELMDNEEMKKWLLDSFGCGVSWMSLTYFGWSFHKFLARLLNGGFLPGDDMLRLLKSKDADGECYILQGYPFGLFTHISPINHHIDNRSFAEELRDVELFKQLKCWLNNNSSLPLNEDLKEVVDKLFEEVRFHDRYGLADKMEVDESGFLVGVETREERIKIHGDRFKFFVVAFFKQVHFCKVHWKECGLVRFLKLIGEPDNGRPNVLHTVYELMPSLCLGYILSILIESLSRGNFLSLLFEPDEDGDTVFHMANRYKNIANWNKLNEVPRALLCENAASVIFPSLKHNGFCKIKEFPQKKEQSENELCEETDRGDDEKHLEIMRLLCLENAKIDDGNEEAGPLAKVIYNAWLENVLYSDNTMTRHVWDKIKRNLKHDRKQLLNYLQWKDRHNFNALARSAYNEDHEVIEFIWELAGEFMDDEEKKMWLFGSFCRVVSNVWKIYIGWSFHKFLERRLNSGFLSGDEILCLLESKDEDGECHILRGYPFGLFIHVLPINHHIDNRYFVERMCDVDFFWNLDDWLNYNSSFRLNKYLKEEVDKLFEEVRSRDRYGLADKIKVDESGFVVGIETKGEEREIHKDRFKFFVVAFFKQVRFFRDHCKEYGLVRFLKLIGKSHRWPNILHIVYERMPLLCLGYVSSILIDSFSRGHFLGLLFETDGDGYTVLLKVFKDSNVDAWNKLSDVFETILSGDAGSADPNEKCRQDMPVSYDAFLEILARWERIWKGIQKDESQSESDQASDMEETDEDEWEEEMDERKEEEDMDEDQGEGEMGEMKRAKRRRVM